MTTTTRDLFQLEDYDSIKNSHSTVSGGMRYLIDKGYSDKEIGLFLGKRPQHVNHVRNEGSEADLHAKRLAEYRKSQETVATVIPKGSVKK